MANIVAIVGRPNVGKSTLFNRLVEQRKAIMDNESGVTRDRHYGYAEWTGKYYTAVDTGGYVTGSSDIFEEAIRSQVKIVLEEASVILFVVDVTEGVTALDEDFAKVLRGAKKPVLIVANKSDNNNRAYMANEFYSMGVGEIFPISAASGSGTGELLDEVVKHFQEADNEDPDEGVPRIAILGRPNVGKSSFLNVLLGVERSIVTDVAGTTRDAINTHYKMYGKDFILTDTAGLRKRAKKKDDIEFFSALRSIQALQDSDVCIVMLDATRGVESQDISIINLASKYKKGIVIMVNKWDLIEKDTHTVNKFKAEIEEKLGLLNFIPLIFTSMVNKQRIFQAMELAMEVHENKSRKISTSELNDVMLKEIEAYPPPAIKGKYVKIKYITQLPTKTPSIAFFCNLPQYVKPAYERYLENKIRKHFNFKGVPINLFFRKK